MGVLIGCLFLSNIMLKKLFKKSMTKCVVQQQHCFHLIRKIRKEVVSRRVLGVFIFDNRPAYPWRQGSELEQAVGGVGVLTTRAGGGGGRRY